MNDIEEKVLEAEADISPSDEIRLSILNRAKAELAKTSPKTTKNPTRLKLILTPVLSFLLILICIGTFLGLRFEKYNTVYIDVNPSLSLTVNRFNTVVDYELINDDSKLLFENVNFTNMKIDDSVEVIVDVLEKNNKLNNAYVAISSAKNNKNSEKLLERINNKLDEIKQKNNYNYKHEEAIVTTEDITEATSSGVGPAKNNVIKEILSLTDEYSRQELTKKTMAELEEILNELEENR